MKITLNEEESESYLDLQENYDNIREVLLLEAEKAVARDAEIATLTATIQELQTTLEAKERIITIQNTANTTRDSFKMDSERHRVERDSQFAKDLEAPEYPIAPWKQEILLATGAEQEDTTSTSRTRWSAEDTQEFRDFILLTGKHGSSHRRVSFLATYFNRTEASIRSKVYGLFNGTRYIKNGNILTRHTPPKGNS